ncbi:MAG: M10 family metallopeptidase [Burkholderiales bacterium]
MPLYTTGSFTFPMSLRDDYRADALLGDFYQNAYGGSAGPQAWGSNVITYSFPTGNALWADGLNYGNGEVRAGWIPFNDLQKAAARKALDAWASVANITFVEVPDGQSVGDIRFAFTYGVDTTAAAHAYHPMSGVATAGDVWVEAERANQTFTSSSVSRAAFYVAIPGQQLPSPLPQLYDQASAFNYQILLHEIGHALGLSHPFAKAGQTRSTAVLPSLEDNYDNTVMSYTSRAHPVTPTTPMSYDILAIQWLYGWNTAHNASDTTYTFDSTEINFLTVYDAGGIDTIKATDQRGLLLSAAVNPDGDIIDLNYYNSAANGPGSGSSIGFYSSSLVDNIGSLAFRFRNIFIAPGVDIENAIGSDARDTIWGNHLNNKITGNLGSDSIDGGAGIDTSIYSANRGSYTVAKTSTGWTVSDNFTTKLITNASASFTDMLSSIERLQFSDVSVALDLTGNAGKVAKILGAVFGPAAVANKAYVGIGLQLLDSGTSYEALTALAIGAASASTPQQIVNLLWTNLMGSAPTAQEAQPYVDLLNGGMTAGQLGVLAADSSFNTARINLAGLISSGIEYV